MRGRIVYRGGPLDGQVVKSSPEMPLPERLVFPSPVGDYSYRNAHRTDAHGRAEFEFVG